MAVKLNGIQFSYEDDHRQQLLDIGYWAVGQGERVLIHCHGGRGRSGLVAARLLIDRGMDAPAALATVRRARPGAVETAGQEAHLTAYAAGRC